MTLSQVVSASTLAYVPPSQSLQCEDTTTTISDYASIEQCLDRQNAIPQLVQQCISSNLVDGERKQMAETFVSGTLAGMWR